ncbi:MAG: N-6 DNA methylase [Acidobacteria bacterium]|nr:N-6 DNA methylase [Acidobacteriota bacterium]MBU4307653.1 N-6 DNA methylase [Acidobacteriota bacterium]MCG2810457.1 N-6 DNA methylase [Candidatus Aminicenantes bacterium]
MPIDEYLKQVKQRYAAGISTEHSYRADLQNLILLMVKGIQVTNEPKRQKCGAPDYIIQKKQVPLGYIEAKDIGVDLNKTETSEQIKRYLQSLENFILTDYLEFRFYKYGQKVHEIKIASIENGKFSIHPECFDSFSTHIRDFCDFKGQTIKSAEKLAKMMAQKARLMEEVLYKAVMEEDENNSLKDQLQAFRRILIHDLKEKTFADIYAQTIAYGLFAARLHDITLENFSRQEARELIPKSNPFLRNLFDYVSGAQLDDRVVWIVDDLADIFRAADLQAILSDFGKTNGPADPFIHFYETFLAAYDPKLRKSRGVYYTPEPVVNFIVRAVDDILQNEFGLSSGLADTSKIKIKTTDENTGKTIEKEIHKVQILDPATGTGTFLAEVIRQIHKKFQGQEGAWSDYVEEHLIPRLNGFEILMASYTMCHLKLEMLLRETGYKAKDESKQQRFRVFLTNSLEEAHPDTGTLFASWLSKESTEANYVKRDTPVMVVMGNPPYSGESANKGEWIMELMEDYKKEPGGKEKLKEQNSKFINDDYVKFLRYGQHFIEKNGSGVLAFINPHGFLDNPTFRGMRWNLLKTYDKIYTIDLHGNAKKKETAPDGSSDVNVFDIEQGVSINLFIKTGKKKPNELGQIFHYDLFGKRELKYGFLLENSVKSIEFNNFMPFKNNFLFKKIDDTLLNEYNKYLNPVDLFQINVMGFQTHRDNFSIDFEMTEIRKRANDLRNQDITNEELYNKYSISDNRDWKLSKARAEIQSDKNWDNKIIHCGYRPFDNRPCYFSYVMMDYPRKELIQNVLDKENLILGIGRQGMAVGDIEWCLTTISKYPVDANMFRRGGVNLFPLYLYPETNGQQNIEQTIVRTSNLNSEIVQKIAENLGLNFTNEKETTEGSFAPIDILDYIYAALHSPTYRKKYKEFLKTDFPRVPYPENADTFWKLVKLGGEIRQIHLLESPAVNKLITTYPVNGNNKVAKIMFESGKVWINDSQYFDKVPQIAWEFYIGGYQPSQKWLKDRKSRELNFEDILHYQKIIVALTETDRIMKEIDKVVEF